MAIRKTYRLECDSKDITAAVDQATGGPIKITRGESWEVQLALFQNGILQKKADIVNVAASILDSDGEVGVEWNASGSSLNSGLTVGAWKRGTDYLCALKLSVAQTTSLPTGTFRLTVSATMTDGEDTGTVIYADVTLDVVSPPAALAPGTAPTPTEDYYTETETDALLAAKASQTELDGVSADLDAVLTWLGYADTDPVEFVSAAFPQTLDATKKAQARTNISAELAAASESATLSGGGTHTPTPAVYRRLVLTLNGNATLANAGTFGDWTPGRIYELVIIQDSTGGRVLTWGNSYVFANGAAINPKPSSTTRFFLRSDGTKVRVSLDEPCEPPQATMEVCAQRSSAWNGSALSGSQELQRGLTITGSVSYGSSVTINGRSAYGFNGSSAQLTFTSVRPCPTASGCTVAIAFDSRGGDTDSIILKSPALGIQVGYKTGVGLYISAIGAADGNKLALPFTTNDSVGKVAVFTLFGAGGGVALDSLGNVAYLSTVTQTTPANGSEYLGSGGSTAYWTGRLARAIMVTRESTHAELCALKAHLMREIGAA